jgi:hypothetical protein
MPLSTRTSHPPGSPVAAFQLQLRTSISITEESPSSVVSPSPVRFFGLAQMRDPSPVRFFGLAQMRGPSPVRLFGLAVNARSKSGPPFWTCAEARSKSGPSFWTCGLGNRTWTRSGPDGAPGGQMYSKLSRASQGLLEHVPREKETRKYQSTAVPRCGIGRQGR